MRHTMLVVFLGLFGFATDVEGRSFRVSQVPNGVTYGCGMCHVNAAGGGRRTGFGSQVESTLEGSDVNWSAIFDQDGDADGYSNGRELGDPDGEWRIGDPNPSGETYDPSERTDSPCGDGMLENPPEDCDGEEMIDVTCEDLGWGPGTLSCNSVCRLIETECEGYESPIDTNNDANVGTNNATTGPTNNATTGPTNNATTGTNGESGVDEPIDEGCCAVLSGRPDGSVVTLWLAIVVALCLRRRG